MEQRDSSNGLIQKGMWHGITKRQMDDNGDKNGLDNEQGEK